MKFSAALIPLIASSASAHKLRNKENGPEEGGRALWEQDSSYGGDSYGGGYEPSHTNNYHQPSGGSCVWSHADTCPHGGRGHCDKDKWLCESKHKECKGTWYPNGCDYQPSYHEPSYPEAPHHPPAHKPPQHPHEPSYPEPPYHPQNPHESHQPERKVQTKFITKALKNGDDAVTLFSNSGPFTVEFSCSDPPGGTMRRLQDNNTTAPDDDEASTEGIKDPGPSNVGRLTLVTTSDRADLYVFGQGFRRRGPGGPTDFNVELDEDQSRQDIMWQVRAFDTPPKRKVVAPAPAPANDETEVVEVDSVNYGTVRVGNAEGSGAVYTSAGNYIGWDGESCIGMVRSPANTEDLSAFAESYGYGYGHHHDDDDEVDCVVACTIHYVEPEEKYEYGW